MISQFTTVLGEADLNIANLVNGSKGEYAYSLIDLDQQVSDEVAEKLRRLDGVLKVRVIK